MVNPQLEKSFSADPNYERLLLISQNFKLIAKGGLGINEEFTLFGSSANHFVTLPHHLTCNFGRNKHHLEVGLGGTVIIGQTNEPYLLYTIIGYRLMPLKKNKVNFRIYGSVPLNGFERVNVIFIPIGLSIGINL